MTTGTVVSNWHTDLYQRRIDAPDFNDRLRDTILEREGRDKSLSLGVVGGRKSSPDLLRWGTDETNEMARYIGEAVDAIAPAEVHASDRLTAHAWAVVYQTGGSHELHAHHDSAWSGVYYLSATPDPAYGGAIELFDPRTAMLARHAATEPAVVSIQPKPGLLICFPSWLLHRVTPVIGDQLRICIAFNIGFER